MFEIGDKVVCIEKTNNTGYSININQVYIVSGLDIQYGKLNYISFKESNGFYINIKFFITLQEHRRRKLLKLKENICLKRVIC